jgi:hypothetical protein
MPAKKAFLLRLPPDLLEELNRWAADDLRSLNAQIEYLLRESVRRRRKRLLDPPPTGRADVDQPGERSA